MEYIIRPECEEGKFIVTKWDFGEVPIEIYKVDLLSKKPTCTCPSGSHRGYCKHIDWCREFRDGQ